MINRRAVLLALPALAGCSTAITGGGDPPRTFTLTPKTEFDPTLTPVTWQLVVDLPVAAQGLNTPRIALKRSPVSVEYYARALWTDAAPVMVQTLLIESFENTRRIVSVSRDATQLRPDYVLMTELREFQAEYEAANAPPMARVRIIARLVRIADRQIIAVHSVERRERAAGTDLERVVLAFDEALGKVLRRIVEWTLRAPARGVQSGMTTE